MPTPPAAIARALGAALWLALAPLPVGARVPAATPATEDERLAAFFEEVYQRELKHSPMTQAQLGIKGTDYGKWDDFSDAEAQRRDARVREDLLRLRAQFDPGRLSAASRLSYRIFEYEQEQALAAFPWRFHNYRFSTMGNAASGGATFLQNIHRIDEPGDAEAYIERIKGTERATAQIIEGIRTAAARGIVPTSFSFDPVLRDTRNLLVGEPFDASGRDSVLLADFRAKVEALKLDATAERRLLDEARTALSGSFRKAIGEYIATVESLRERSGGAGGVWQLPDGAAYYASRIEYYTTDRSLSADAIHALGLDEVRRIRAEMQAIVRELGFEGDLQAFFAHLQRDPANFFPDTEAGRQAYLEQSKACIEAIYADVGRYFNILPKAPLEVRRVEAWREATSPIAFYNSPSPDGSRPGYYYVNLRDMRNLPKHELETVAYHEGAPGHHFQQAIQQELQGVPSFQKFVFFGAYVEGWGLYAERLAKEQGRFTDPLQDFGRLQNEMWRAVRLVVDTGAHTRRWSREQMVDYMRANVSMSPETALKEAERYLDQPGQALSYKIGMERILALRAKARAALGARFDIRAFHDVVLRSGSLPLPILESQVEEWIATTRGERGAVGG
jgi:uncharacterized protein (DUF885 family)